MAPNARVNAPVDVRARKAGRGLDDGMIWSWRATGGCGKRVSMSRTLAAVAAALLALAACRTDGTGRPIPSGLGESEAREVLHRFARAVQERRWPEAYALLSGRWRAVYTPARLGADHEGAGPASRDAAERVLALLAAGAPLEGGGGRVALPVGAGRAATLVAEAGGWRVDALE
jgi:hypothetical protein